MKREDIVNAMSLEDAIQVFRDTNCYGTTDIAKTVILKALEQAPKIYVLDKIREEVEGLKTCVALDEEGEFWYRDALNDAIEIIDKYIDRDMRGAI